jgi:hypothetical protein
VFSTIFNTTQNVFVSGNEVAAKFQELFDVEPRPLLLSIALTRILHQELTLTLDGNIEGFILLRKNLYIFQPIDILDKTISIQARKNFISGTRDPQSDETQKRSKTIKIVVSTNDIKETGQSKPEDTLEAKYAQAQQLITEFNGEPSEPTELNIDTSIIADMILDTFTMAQIKDTLQLYNQILEGKNVKLSEVEFFYDAFKRTDWTIWNKKQCVLYFDYFNGQYYEYHDSKFEVVSEIKIPHIEKRFTETQHFIKRLDNGKVKAFRTIIKKSGKQKMILKIILPDTIKNDGTVCQTRRKEEMKPLFDEIGVDMAKLPKKKNNLCLLLEYFLREKTKNENIQYFRRPYHQYIHKNL